MKNVLITLLLAASCFAQTTTKKPAAKPQSECSIALKATAQASDSMSAQLADARAEIERLKKENQEISKKSVDLRDAAMQVYNESVQIQQAFKHAVDENVALTEKYNRLLDDAKEQLQRANAEMASMNSQYAKQQRFANALAIYSLMPKPQPYVLPQPVAPPPPVNLQCTTSSIGNTAYTNCH